MPAAHERLLDVGLQFIERRQLFVTRKDADLARGRLQVEVRREYGAQAGVDEVVVP